MRWRCARTSRPATCSTGSSTTTTRPDLAADHPSHAADDKLGRRLRALCVLPHGLDGSIDHDDPTGD